MTMKETDSVIRTKGSLCTGTGSLDEAVPGELSWYSEIESAPAAALAARLKTPNLGDMTKVNFGSEHHVDLLTSGDPCQSMSIAGPKKASEDVRFLWPHVIETIRKVRPREIFLENVQNIVSVALVKGATDWRGERGSVLKMRLDDLREAGYAVKWMVLGACAVGAPHHRHRWFLRARFVGPVAPAAERVMAKCGAPRGGGRFVLPSPRASDGSRGAESNRSGRTGTGGTLLDAVALLPTPTPRATDGVNGGPNQRGSSGDLAMGSACQPEHFGKFAAAVALWERITSLPAPEPTVPAPRGGRRLNPELSEWMMGYRRGQLTSVMDRNAALKAAGNGVVARQARAAWELLR